MCFIKFKESKTTICVCKDIFPLLNKITEVNKALLLTFPQDTNLHKIA